MRVAGRLELDHVRRDGRDRRAVGLQHGGRSGVQGDASGVAQVGEDGAAQERVQERERGAGTQQREVDEAVGARDRFGGLDVGELRGVAQLDVVAEDRDRSGQRFDGGLPRAAAGPRRSA